MSRASTASAAAVRRGARWLSVLILLFWGFFMIAHLLGDEGRPSRPLVWADYAALASLVSSLAGLALAWRWERAGAFVTLAAVAACAAVNWKILVSPGALIPAAAALFLLSWWAHRPRRHADAAGVG